jgi:hypothetical protein
MKRTHHTTVQRKSRKHSGSVYEPADAVVVTLFNDIRCARCRLGTDIERGPWSRATAAKDRAEMKWYERKAWDYLMQYLATAEVPDWIVEDQRT